MEQLILEQYLGFEWDAANEIKNVTKHQVSCAECEQIFFNTPLLCHEDSKHSLMEMRAYALGRTDSGRELFIAFTNRNNLIRVISARDMSKKERKVYAKAKENSEIYI